MDTSDDPFLTPTVIGGALLSAGLGVGVTALTGGFKKPDTPSYTAQAGQATKTAEPITALSEQAKRNKRLAASSLTKGFAEPTLGTPGLLGM